ncbi:MAG: hypothetical protein K8L97_05635 [Anaerolineae bacterium]|nr:hypothetical protein [Anaerolineae bacterium]
MLSIQRILIDGSLLSLALGLLIMASLYYNPRLWLQDFPAEIRAKLPPVTPREKRDQYILMIPFMLLMFGFPVYSAVQLKLANGGSIDFLTAYLHIALIAHIFNLFDAVVLDWLILTVMKPKFAIPPGAEGMEYLLADMSMQFKNFLKGIVICTVFSLPLAVLAMIL